MKSWIYYLAMVLTLNLFIGCAATPQLVESEPSGHFNGLHKPTAESFKIVFPEFNFGEEEKTFSRNFRWQRKMTSEHGLRAGYIIYDETEYLRVPGKVIDIHHREGTEFALVWQSLKFTVWNLTDRQLISREMMIFDKPRFASFEHHAPIYVKVYYRGQTIFYDINGHEVISLTGIYRLNGPMSAEGACTGPDECEVVQLR